MERLAITGRTIELHFSKRSRVHVPEPNCTGDKVDERYDADS